MARLAAYFQEDFHYAPVGYGSKQRKAAYVVYDDARNAPFNNGYIDGGPRIRALASSEPSLSPIHNYSPTLALNTVRTKHNAFNNQMTEQSRVAMQRLVDMYIPPEDINPYALARLQPDTADCQSVCSYRGYSAPRHDRHKAKSKDKLIRRLSYDAYSPELYSAIAEDSSNSLPVQSHGEMFPAERNFVEHPEIIFTPPVSFRSDASRERWQQWPWNAVDTHASPALLSPPSPLDSGLSSQSITSSPSLEAEPVSVHAGHLPIIQSDGPHVCSCVQRVYVEHVPMIPSPGRHDSGRSSPGIYTVAPKHRRNSVRVKNGHHTNVYVENDFEDLYPRGQVRYGMLGLLGEPVQQLNHTPNLTNGQQSDRRDYVPNNKPLPVNYYIEDGVSHKKHHSPRHSKPQKLKHAYTQPNVVIVEASEKSSSGNGSSPDQLSPDKSPEPDSCHSADISNSTSNSSSATSTRIEQKNDERRRTNRTIEKQIRELEDMYKKLNLGDYDLLDRAERRDLPTAHQLKADRNYSTLTRSKSDTFYEMSSPLRGVNPYEVAQRAPPLRRSGIPDRVADDMALRKHYKPVTASSCNPADNSMTYMLCSSHFTPTVSGGKDILYPANPDIEYDDFSYRKHYFGKKSKISDPQPPFGIPLRPPPPQSVHNDYLHAVPMDGPKPLCHPRGNPDVVRDDMAYRTLRKDEPELWYYDAADMYRKIRT